MKFKTTIVPFASPLDDNTSSYHWTLRIASYTNNETERWEVVRDGVATNRSQAQTHAKEAARHYRDLVEAPIDEEEFEL